MVIYWGPVSADKIYRGEVCIFVKKDQCLNKIDTSHHYKEQDFEMYAVQLETKAYNLITFSFIS
jgi:hypothetical protein